MTSTRSLTQEGAVMESAAGGGAHPEGRAPRQSTGKQRGIAALIRLIHLGPLLVLILFWIVMSLASPHFFSTLNISNLALATAIPAALALGQFLVILTGGIDLSAGAVYVLATIVGAKLAEGVTSSAIVVIAAMIGVGALVGLINGILIEYVRVGTSLIVTLGTLSCVTGAAYVVSGGGTILGFPSLIGTIGSGYVGSDIPIAALIVAGLAILTYLASARFRWGRWVYAIGSNRDAAARVGVPVRPVVVSVFILSGVAAGIAGIFSAGLTNAASPVVTFNAELDAISAVVIGGAALAGGRGSVWGTMAGALILGTIHNALNLLDVNTNWEPIVLGAVLLLAIGLDRARNQLEIRLRLLEARMAGDL